MRSNKLDILYIYLMQELQASRLDWYNEYIEITNGIKRLQSALIGNDNLKINDPSIYEGANDFTDWENFLRKMFANGGNGISSNGQSVFSYEMFELAKENDEFIRSLTNLIKNPDRNNHENFAKTWRKIFNKNNLVQTNRASAACDLNLSSTVDENKFNIIFDWFIKNKYIAPYEGNNTWYEKNIYLVKQIRSGLKNEEGNYILEDNNDIRIDDYWVNVFIWLAYENIANPFHLNKQIVKYGAPGTGKTYSCKQICSIQFELWKRTYGSKSNLLSHETIDIIQFHPTYSYEDFVEGLRPVSSNGTIQLQLKNGVFKQICKKASKWESDLYAIDRTKSLNSWKIKDIKESEDICFNEEYWSFVKNLDDDLVVADVLPPYFLIIDEINRAELSAVFGELMFCLEYRGAENAIKTQYSELNNDETTLIKIQEEYKFYVPHNLYLIGTMNTIDRSVDSFDFALRRRFRWEEVQPNMDLLRMNLSSINYDWINLTESINKLNDLISNEELLGKDYKLGHAYFWNLNYPKYLSLLQLKKQIWNDRIGSLIEEYLRGTGRNDLINLYKDTFLSN